MDKEIRVIDRAVEVDGTPIRVLGLRLDEEGTVHLEAVIDIGARNRLVEELTRAGLVEAIEHPATNREYGRYEIEYDWYEPLLDVQTVEIGGVRFRVSGGTGDRWHPDRPSALAAACLKRGWVPPAPEDLWCRDMKMRGTFETLPETDGPLRFIRAPKRRKILAETPVTLTVGEGGQRIEDSEGRWVHVTEVVVADIQIQFYAQQKEDDTPPPIPQGMGVPTLVYECPEDLTPEFFTADWLEEKPTGNRGSFGALMRIPKERGPNGLPLRPASVEGVAPLGAQTLQAELFSWEQKEPQSDILL